jgi:hypothetical protein
VRQRTKRVWYPHYLLVSNEDRNDSIDHLIASAALPYGLTAGVRLGIDELVDDGVVDMCRGIR